MSTVEQLIEELEHETDVAEQQDLIRVIQTYPLTEEQKAKLKKYKQKSISTIAVISTKSNSNTERLRQSLEQLVECEKDGQDSINHLQSQHEQIKRQHTKVKGINDNLNWSNKLATKMSSIFR